MKSILSWALASLLIISSITAAGATFTISHFKIKALTAMRSLEAAAAPPDVRDANWVEAKGHMVRINRRLAWLRSHQNMLVDTFYIGGVVSATTGLALLLPVLLVWRTTPVPSRFHKFLAAALLGLIISAATYALWASDTHEIPSINRHLGEMLQDIEAISEETPADKVSNLLFNMTSCNQQLQTSIVRQAYSLVFFSLGICLWPIGIVPLVAFRNKHPR